MADEQQLAVLRQGVDAWNAWRQQNPNARADLSGANLAWADLSGADLAWANLSKADLTGADLSVARLFSADLFKANLSHAHFAFADLALANLSWANLSGTSALQANLSRANLSKADLSWTILLLANLSEANLNGTDFTAAVLTGCRVYGTSLWDVKLDGAEQKDLIITPHDEPEITVDNLEVAQFIYLLLNNEKIRHVIDTITSKVVLILGRFTPERKAVLDALREELRRRDYTPVLFDFDKPASQDLQGTVETLARMARFVIADITEASSVPAELQAIVPHLRTVPVQPLLMTGAPEYALFAPLRAYPWVLELFEYRDMNEVHSSLDRIIGQAEAKARELRGVSPPTG